MNSLRDLFPEVFTTRFLVLNVILVIVLSIVANLLTVLLNRISSPTWLWLRKNGSNVGSWLTLLSVLAPFVLGFAEKAFQVRPPKDISVVMVPLLLFHATGVGMWSLFYELGLGWPKSGSWSWIRLLTAIIWSCFMLSFPVIWFWTSVLARG